MLYMWKISVGEEWSSFCGQKKNRERIFFLPNDIFVKHFRKHLGPTDLKNNWNCYLSNNGNLRKEGLYFAVILN